jgi:hypothetical protein
MQINDNGAYYTVTCSEDAVQDFACRWPCFGSVNPLAFTFDKRNGDLVDIEGEHEHMDEGGVLALSHAAQEWSHDNWDDILGDRPVR